jgi:DeoR/GlpR family transcriptional regulator of sugar metabolism|nr:DNA-binding transcriptional regulator YciT [uncultured Tolumonas sp.]
MNARQTAILELVNCAGKVSVADLSNQLGVSEVTIRQDLTQLEQQSFLKRVHGAAAALDSENPEHRQWTNSKIKQDIANYAYSLIKQDDCVLIEGGSVNVMLAKLLAKRSDITIITSNSYIAHQLRTSNAGIILLGGQYQSSSESLVGPLTRLCIEHIHFSKAFIGVDGFDIQTGFTNRNMLRADIANTILNKKQEVFVMTDSSKFGTIHPASIGPTSLIRHVITDKNAPNETLRWLSDKNVQVHIV